MTVRPFVVVSHASFRPERVASLERMRQQLRDIDYAVIEDAKGIGSLAVWRQCMLAGLARAEATHIVYLPDDAVLPDDYVQRLRRTIERWPHNLICGYTNHPLAAKFFEAGHDYYTTSEGSVIMSGVWPRALLEEQLAWREATLVDPWGPTIADDLGTNMFAMATGRPIVKTLPSLADHLPPSVVPSLQGNDGHEFRTAVVPPGAERPELPRAADPAILGRTYKGNHWRLVYDTKPEKWTPELLDRMYEVERNEPVDSTPHVMIATPAYTPAELPFLQSRDLVIRDLMSNGIHVSQYMTGGDSLVTRGRHVLMHTFLCSTATHLLQWDADVECLTIDAVRLMLGTGHDVIGGAYPFRDGSGHVVANPRYEDRVRKLVDIDANGVTPVDDIGTGFLLTSRKVLYELACLHPELLYESDQPAYRGAPMWALFDTALEMQPHGRRRYASEDWRFCTHVRNAGKQVNCFVRAEFAHWGKHGHRGTALTAWGTPQ